MNTKNSPQVWRVECDDGVREVTLTREEDGYIRASAADRTALAFHPDTPPRAAVATFAGRCGWPVVGVLAPGQPTRSELDAEVRRLRTLLEGRATMPTATEADTLEDEDGCWLVTLDWGDGGPPVLDLYSAHDVRQYTERSEAKGDDLSCRVTTWRALNRDGRLVPPPVSP